ncbi:MarR family winged helix-turn-helix transcriptional regulator [Priestia megaterium]|uniref:MarR family winged helix-turn-helix transcriptional regulator n=2 Tax=Priestia megaterium TaxID=1404 RepID=UPI000BED15F7|nr:MarR family winged helix-turn-helix transcriptional regulator [Priestia megaterium]MDP9579883.1 DNA-binding MarR family transcriptional regulator [Bacillus sp. 1751]MED4068410.1 MarR family winged helix-turn-helix transcriptional regulator [Priestia megaterium]PEA35366.1 MarR family transcriptional regulator [Priestia megaterium]PFK45488.1 MarR family transcriptional regulator [Priestia megaterium]PGR77399.1 MarR family transcriptional regulator [Priestia megaterium]
MKWVSKFNNPEDSSGFLLWQVTHAWQRLITKELSKINVTHSQFVLLAACDFLQTKGENVTQKNLADFTKLNIMMISDVVRTIETKGLLERSKNPLDKREILLSITAEGKNKVKQGIPIVEKVDEQFFNNIKDTQDDFNEMLHSLL